ncbi:MAG: hypothetical protein ACI9JL_004525 [Paracoccaceae bacterium]|jgi:hypothetical protein
MTGRKPVSRKPEEKAPASAELDNKPRASGHGRTLYLLIERKLQDSSGNSAYIPPEQLARALRFNPGVPVPQIIQDYLIDLLEGEIRVPAGRRPDRLNVFQVIKRELIPLTYARYHTWLTKRKKSVGLEGWSCIEKADWWQGPPSERAARMTCRYLGLAMDWHRVLNVVSEMKN